MDFDLDRRRGHYFVKRHGTRGPPVLAHNACNLHHPIPKFLGGWKTGQTLAKLTEKQHRAFHKMLHEELKKRGFKLSGLGGRTGSTKLWRAHFARNPGSQQKALSAVRAAARRFDRKYGKNLSQQVNQNIKAGQFRAIP